MLNISLDAGSLAVIDKNLRVGVYRIVLHLLEGLSSIDTKNTYTLYTFDTIEKRKLDRLGPNYKNNVLLPRIGWSRVRLPLELFIQPPDVFLGLSQHLPPGPGKKIGFIYDLGFLKYPEAYPGSARQLRRITESVVRRADHIVTISEATRQDIINTYHVSEDMITVAYPGIDGRFTSRGKKRKEEYPYILFVGSLKKGKNVPALIRGFAAYKKKYKSAHKLIIIGSTRWLDEEISREIKSCRIQSNVILRGFVSDEELPEYYRGAAAFVSLSRSEGFGLPPAEAAACGARVLVSDIDVHREILGTYAKYVDPMDDARVAHMMHESLHSAKKSFSKKKYSWKSFAQTVLKVIDSVHG